MHAPYGKGGKMPNLLENFKLQFHRGQKIHLNNAGQSPISRPAFAALQHWANVFYEDGAHGFPPLDEATTLARIEIAQFLGAKTNEIAFFPGTAGAISQIALGFDFKPGDEILIWDQEYPSNFYPWNEAAKRAGAHSRPINWRDGNSY
jgi:cysteine desulfurase / selenocysteine lyase